MSSKMKNFYFLTDVSEKYSKFGELLVQQGWTLNKLNLSVNLSKQLHQALADNTTKACIAILNPETHRFSSTDIQFIRKLVAAGNCLIVASGDEETAGGVAANLNQLTSIYGVIFRKNSVIRPNPYKQYHPKEVMLNDFVVNRSFSQLVRKHCSPYANSNELPLPLAPNERPAFKALYANGCSLQVEDDSNVIMTSSNYAIPPNQAICTFSKGLNNSNVLVLGSASFMSNAYIDCENNKALVLALIDICRDEHFTTNQSDARTLELPEMVYTGDMETLIDLPMGCFETLKPLPDNKTALIERHLFNLDCSKLPLVVEAYARLGVPNEPLTLLKPQFHCQYLKLEPATHGFLLRRPSERDQS